MDYKVMHKGKVIALANENGISGIIDKSLCPACFAIGMPLEIWLDNTGALTFIVHIRGSCSRLCD